MSPQSSAFHCIHAGILLGLFCAEDGGDKFIRNVCWLATDYAVIYPRWYLLFMITLLVHGSFSPSCLHLQVKPNRIALIDTVYLSRSIWLGPTRQFLREAVDRIQSPKKSCFKYKAGRWIMYRIVIVILIYHRHKPIDSISLLGS
jgi:hypothetical protein